MLRDLNSKIPGAPNFQYKEFVKSYEATRLGIINEPNEKEWQCIEKVAVEILQPIRNKFGRIRITSGFRSELLCLQIGSTITSNHVKGQAVDIEPIENGVTLLEVLEWIHENLEYRELIAEYFPQGWIHVAYRENSNIKKLKLKDSTHHYSAVDINYIKKLYKQ